MSPPRLVLAIETSCDETAASVVGTGRVVRSSIVASQHELHAEYRGVVPEIASRAHAERILPVVRGALDAASVAPGDVHAVAVGHRPGLIGSLLVGVGAAKALALTLGVPLIGVDHVHAHLYAPLLGAAPVRLPALGLVVSGGHTALYRIERWEPHGLTRLGSTIDDAVGEAYDKAATILGLPFPGGPLVDRLAADGDARAVDLPVSRLAPRSLDFSFSGLKTALLYAAHGVPTREGDPPRSLPPTVDGRRRADLCASFQRAAIGAVMLKLRRGLGQWDRRGGDAPAVLVGGGVSANSLLRAELDRLRSEGVEVRAPAMEFCIDNAAMIGGLAHEYLDAGHVSGLGLEAMPTTGTEEAAA
ncbi:MAG: tRNA (adenosine(37)-N6)-threonylcarbamoyltransferase complex transferase subunit TsaD [Phycisphaerae bacterium]|nr:tRNA (adenosine(37)-N6)-threonylcarbamoyltransferase complex transferase subunit TsaD [Phycisphaerae bacterium]